MIDNAVRAAYTWACERLYHEFAWSYDAVSRLVSAGQWDRWRMLALDRVQGPRVLELGFGTGVLLRRLAETGHVAYGIDPSPAMHAIARRRLNEAGVTAWCVQAAGQQLPFPNGFFDTVVATFPAPYILDPLTLAECVRVLRVSDSQQQAGRLIVVGLWVGFAAPALRNFPGVFYGTPSSVLLAGVQARLVDAGFTASITTAPVAWARVGIIEAQLQPLPAEGQEPR
jgi:SAM-dependent methyltransferase